MAELRTPGALAVGAPLPMSAPSVACVVCTIPPRRERLLEALHSVVMQTHPVDQIVVVRDQRGVGTAAMRSRAFAAVDCEWAFALDDDDVLEPTYVQRVVAVAGSDVDVIYTGYHVNGGSDPFDIFGQPFDADRLRASTCIPGACVLVRREFLDWGIPVRGDWDYARFDDRWPGIVCEDWAWLLRLLNAGARFRHVPEKLWRWRHWGVGSPGVPGNTGGRPEGWR